ncbi:MAG: reverse transcriptase-like protein, partial [Chloroflexota bacterium]
MDSEGMAEMERPMRELGKGVAGPGRHVYVAGALALTEPGPAAAGLVVTDEQGRTLAHRAHYLGHTTRHEATVQALLSAARLALAGGLEAPVFRIDDPALADALSAARAVSGEREPLMRALREALAEAPGHRIEVIPANTNRARAVALTPLVDWLPERTRRAEALHVRALGDGVYEVESESQPGQVYHVTLKAADA